MQECGSYAGELSSLVAPNLSDLTQKKKAQIKRLFTAKDQLSARLDKVEDQAHKVGGSAEMGRGRCGCVKVGRFGGVLRDHIVSVAPPLSPFL